MVFTQGAKRFLRRQIGAAHDRGCAGGAAAPLPSTSKRETRRKRVTGSAQVDQFGLETNVTRRRQKKKKKDSIRMRAISKHTRVLLVNANDLPKQTCKTNKATFEMRWECVW